MRSDRADGDPADHFLEDGVAPSVIGGGPPESPFELDPEPEPRGRHSQHRPEPDHYQAPRQEPPTSPIPVFRQQAAAPEPEKRKGFLARMLRLPDKQ